MFQLLINRCNGKSQGKRRCFFGKSSKNSQTKWWIFQQAMFDDTGGYFIWVKKKLYLWDAAQLMLHPEPGSGFLTQNVCTYDVHLLGGLEHEFHFSIQLVFSSSQLTFTPSFW
jgi:hypothetical protein